MATKTRRSRPKAGTFRVDFAKEEGGGGRFRVKEGDYRVKIMGAKPTTSSEKGTPGLEVKFKIMEGRYEGKEFTDTLWNTPKALFRFRDLLESLGLEVPKRAVDIPLKKLKGKELGVTLTDDEYEGRTRSRVSDFIDLDTLSEADEEDLDEDDEDEDEEDSEDDEDEDDDDEEEGADLDEMDRSELKAYIKENELDVKVKKSMDEDDIREAIQEAEGDDDDDDSEDLDELDLDDDL